MNNIDQMIEVLEAFKRGEKIEFKNNLHTEWEECGKKPLWNFHLDEYRIAKPEPKKVKLQAWIDDCGELRRITDDWDEDHTKTWIRIPEEDKEITLP